MLELLESRWLPNNLLGALQPVLADADAPTAYALAADDPPSLLSAPPDAGAPAHSFAPAVQTVSPSTAALAPSGIGDPANRPADVTPNAPSGIDDPLAQMLTFWDVSPQANTAADSLAGIQPATSAGETPSASAPARPLPAASSPSSAPTPTAPPDSGGPGGSGGSPPPAAPGAQGGISVTAFWQNLTEGAAATSGTLATFNDSDGNSDEGFTATVDWGDGTGAQPATVNGDPDARWVTGGHAYAEEGTYTITVTVTGSDGDVGSGTATAQVYDALLSGSGASITATAGQSFTAAAATFTDADPNGAVGDYSATVWWGDGASSPGTVVAAPGGAGGFEVDGTHTYASAGTYTTAVFFTDVGGASGAAPGTAVVSGSDGGGGLGGGDGGSGGLGGQTLNFAEGAPAPASTVVATFTDPDGNTDPTQYQATVNWGDGTPTQTAAVSFASGQFQVTAGHTYAEEGAYTAAVAVTDSDGASGSVQDTATVADAALSGSNAADFPVAVGEPFTAPVAYFNDADPDGELGDYSATVAWGDGSSSAGTVVLAPAGGPDTFEVDGTHAYAAAGPYPVSVAIGDVGGSTTNANLTITAVNGPVLANPGDQFNAEGDAVSLPLHAMGNSLVFGASGLPAGLAIDSSTGLISGTLDYTDAETQGGAYSVTAVVYDASGASASQTFSWDVSDTNTPPTLDNPGDQTNAEGDGVQLQLTASDPDGDALTYSAAGLPDGLSINPTTGLISGIVAADAGASSPDATTITVSDGVQSVSQSFTWTVSHVYISSLPDQSNLDGDAASVQVSAWTTSGLPLQYGASGLPAGLTIDANTGLISGTVGATDSQSGPYAVTATASDGTDSASTSFTWDVAHLAVVNPGDQTNAEGDAVSLQIGVSDNADDTLTYGASGLPNGLSIDPTSGVISGTVAALDANGSPYSVTVTASDGGASDSQTFNWTIAHVVIADPGPQIDAPGDTVSLPIQASDPDGDALTFGATGLPAGLSINATTGVIAGAISSTAGSDTPYSVIVSASDGTETATLPITWTVTNGGVAVTNPGGQTNAEGDNVSLSISATDPTGLPLTFAAVGLPSGLSIDPASGVISGTVDYTDAETQDGVYAVTVSADDGQGSNGSATFTWTVSHTNQAPVLDDVGDQLNAVGDTVSLGLGAYDPDGDTLTFSASGLPAGLTIDGSTGLISGTPSAAGTDAVTVTASDGSLTDAQTFDWYVTNAQVVVTNPGDQTNNEADVVSLQIAAQFPASATGESIAATGLPTGLAIDAAGLISGTISYSAAEDAPGGVYNVTVSAQDAAGDTGGVQFLWNVNDVIRPPTLTDPGAQTTPEGTVESLQVQASSPDGETLSYYASGLPAGLGIDPNSGAITGTVAYGDADPNGGIYTTTVTVQDDAGHTVSQQFAWTVTDVNTAPTLGGGALAQSNVVGDAPTLQLYGGDVDGDAVTYSAAGLPTGLSIDATSGLISGTILATGSYDVTATVSDGSLTALQTFTWDVSASGAEVTLAINGTMDHAGGVALVGAGAIPVVVTLLHATPGEHDVTLELPGESADLSSLSQTAFQLIDGGSLTVWLTALQPSAAEDDVQLLAFVDNNTAIAGDGHLTNEQVTFEKDIKNADTPAGMADRIPPTAFTPTTVTLNVTLDKGQKINLTVHGNSQANGDADFHDATGNHGFIELTKAGANDVSLVGTAQTQPTADGRGGNAGNLKLHAFVFVNDVGAPGVDSNGFSVAAIPIQVIAHDATAVEEKMGTGTDANGKPTWTGAWGAHYEITMVSDSGPDNQKDLGAVMISESLVSAQKNVTVGKFVPGTDKFDDDNQRQWAIPQQDLSGKAISEADAKVILPYFIKKEIDQKGRTQAEFEQYVVFTDARTGWTDEKNPLLVNASGFKITAVTEQVMMGGRKVYHVVVQRTAMANHGVAPGVISDADAKEVIAVIK